MPEAVVFISRNKVKDGMLDAFRRHYRESLQPTLEGKPGTLVQLGYENEVGSEFTVLRIFPDADALDQQILGADERSKKTYTFIEPTEIEIFGTPNPATLEKMIKIAGTGITVKISPYYSGGFIR